MQSAIHTFHEYICSESGDSILEHSLGEFYTQTLSVYGRGDFNTDYSFEDVIRCEAS